MDRSKAAHLCGFAQDQMIDSTTILSHLFAIVAGFVVRGYLSVEPASSCPACVVTCGNVSCPTLSCTTGHFEVGQIALVAIFSVLILLIGLPFWWRRSSGVSSGTTGGRGLIVDGRRPLGAAIGWRPEAR